MLSIAGSVAKGTVGASAPIGAAILVASVSTIAPWLQAVGYGIGGAVGLATFVSVIFDIKRKFRDRNK